MCSVQGTGVQATSGWYRAGYILLFIVYVQSSVLCTVLRAGVVGGTVVLCVLGSL